MTVVTADLLQGLIAAALGTQAEDDSWPTAAAGNVFTPRTWRTPAALMPVLLIQSPSERKENQAGRLGAAEFWTTGTFRIVGRVFVKATATDPVAAALAAEAAVATLQRQVEVAVINADPIRRAVQQFVSVETTTDVKSDGGATFGEMSMNLTLEYYQGPEDFAPVPADAITEFAVYADLINVFSPTGDFTGSEPFAGTPAPRTAGPDGRPEGKLLLPVTAP